MNSEELGVRSKKLAAEYILRTKKSVLFLISIFVSFFAFLPPNAQVISEKLYPTAIAFSTPQSIDNLVGHYNNKIKFIFSDIDGTIIPLDKKVSKRTISENTKISVQKLKQAHIPLILVTGRSYKEAKNVATEMGNENNYIITFQGAQIINPNGKIIYRDDIKNKDFKKIIKNLESFNKLYNQNSKPYFVLDGEYYSMEKTNFPYLWQKMKVIKSIDELKPNAQPSKIEIYESNPKKIKLLQAYFKKLFPDYHVNVAADCYCCITSKTATKGVAIKKLAGILNINLQNSAALGDAENDISMLNLIRTNRGVAIAVGNAMNNVKSNANFITSPVDNDGFANAVNKILLNNSALK